VTNLTNASTRKKLLESCFLIQFETFNEIRSALEEIFSPSAASVILYESAKKCGGRLCERLMEKARKREEVLNHMSKLNLEENWGKISFRDMDLKKGSGKIWVDHPFEMMACGNNKCDCPFLRGFLAGFLSKLFNKDMTVVNVKCNKEKKHCWLKFASPFALYGEEARKTRDRIIKEMSLKRNYY